MLLTLRKAKYEDLIKTYTWANDQEVIKNSIERSNKVSLKEHLEWFNKYINSKSKTLIIASFKNQKIGLVRMDLNKKDYFISYLVDKKKRRKGFGYEMLKKIIEKYKLTKNNFKARVKKNNYASNSIFLKLGFKIKYTNNNKKIILYELRNHNAKN